MKKGKLFLAFCGLIGGLVTFASAKHNVQAYRLLNDQYIPVEDGSYFCTGQVNTCVFYDDGGVKKPLTVGNYHTIG